MIRFLILVITASLSGAASAQVADTARTTPSGGQPSVSSVAAETRVQDEAFAAWKVRYAINRAKVVQDIKVVQQELASLDPAKDALKQQLTNLLNGTVRRWNDEKTDFADPDQFTGCQALFATIRQAIRNGALNR